VDRWTYKELSVHKGEGAGGKVHAHRLGHRDMRRYRATQGAAQREIQAWPKRHGLEDKKAGTI
jgi:hypothetical protein